MLRRTACMLAVLLFICPVSGFAVEEQQTDGRVSVLLTSLSGTQAVDIGIYGHYMADNSFSFQRGTQLLVRAQGDRLLAFFDGAVYRAGNDLVFRRFSAEDTEENGLRINGGLHLFEGDLQIKLRGGLLDLIVEMDIEDYLLGVVPYEMSEDFPLEALKAQAVAARTYTLSSLKPGEEYDVVDNTNDQVFRGRLSDHPKAAAAVRETSGQALTYHGELAQAFYTASNGGQTESAYNAWGRERIPYLTVREDQADYDNPDSLVRKADLPKAGQALSVMHPLLYDSVVQGLTVLMEQKGYSSLPEHIEILTIEHLRALHPAYREPESKVYTALEFGLRVRGTNLRPQSADKEVALFTAAEAAPASPSPNDFDAALQGRVEMVPEILRVELPLYPTLEQQLGLSINLKQNETIGIADRGDHYAVEARRYGHGVGMSQRGAEWMALSGGASHKEILAFYYPGTEMREFVTRSGQRETLALDYLTTPGPRPTATPRPTAIPLSTTPGPGEYIALVTGIAQNSSLNLRLQPSTASAVVQVLYYGQQLLVHRVLEDGWLEVSVDGLRGFVVEQFTQKRP